MIYGAPTNAASKRVSISCVTTKQTTGDISEDSQPARREACSRHRQAHTYAYAPRSRKRPTPLPTRRQTDHAGGTTAYASPREETTRARADRHVQIRAQFATAASSSPRCATAEIVPSYEFAHGPLRRRTFKEQMSVSNACKTDDLEPSTTPRLMGGAS